MSKPPSRMFSCLFMFCSNCRISRFNWRLSFQTVSKAPTEKAMACAGAAVRILLWRKPMKIVSRGMAITIAALSLTGWRPAASAPVTIETVLYSFKGGPIGPDGAFPNGLIADKEGALFGTTLWRRDCGHSFQQTAL